MKGVEEEEAAAVAAAAGVEEEEEEEMEALTAGFSLVAVAVEVAVEGAWVSHEVTAAAGPSSSKRLSSYP